ncbi:MAG: UDP-2,3-diacylglucosamine diphosphatase [Bacteroidales bacterium]|jgi:UDP-2,3-diacylglucosamine hydrolase|nr:UDP-2,3-diacylglucosamine diphosphatase [Bacteroidales bacterium]
MKATQIILDKEKVIFFLSDLHLGIPNPAESLKREKETVDFFLKNRQRIQEIFLLGDIFDFWFEYKKVVPKGFVRLFGTLAQLSDEGINIHYFKGNHDFGIDNYFEKELGVNMYSGNHIFDINGKIFFVGHGDGYGKGGYFYKILKKMFNSQFCQKIFASIHPRIGLGLANYFSGKSRNKNECNKTRHCVSNEMLEMQVLLDYSKKILEKNPEIDYFIFGHYHTPVEIKLNDKTTYFNIGDWLKHRNCIIFDGKNAGQE